MFRLDNYVIDRVYRAYLLDSDDKLIGYLDQLQDTSIEMSSETQDITSNTGVLIKRFYRSKAAQLSASNAILNLNVVGLQLGSEKITADGTVTFDMPMSALVKAGETVTLDDIKASTTPKVYGLTASGSATVEYELDTTASPTKFAFDTSTNVLTPPTATDEVQYFVYYEKTVTSGVKYVNSADEFPRTVKIRIEVTYITKTLYRQLPIFRNEYRALCA